MKTLFKDHFFINAANKVVTEHSTQVLKRVDFRISRACEEKRVDFCCLIHVMF